MSIVNIPTGSKNADTVDGKHADEFAPSGYGLGGASQFVTGDWNNYMKTGFYYGRDLLNQPPTLAGANTTWFVISIKFSDDRWCTQVAFNAQNINLNYIRKKINNTWSQWAQLNDGGIADTIKNTLPINKGGTGATSVVNALKNLNLLNHNISNTPSCSPLVYKNYTDFGISSLSMHNFIRQIPEHSFFVFENNKNATTYITDAPYNLGVIYAFRGYIHNGYALFFSGQGDNGSIYHFLCNRDVILQNWTKINDGGNALTLNNHEDSYFATATQMTTTNNTLNNKVDKVTGKGLSTNDFTTVYKTKLDSIANGSKDNVQSDWNVTASNSDAFIKNKPTSFPANGGNADTVDGKHASEFATASQITTINNALNNKVDKVSGKGLSTNDFTAAYKSKLDGIATGSEANVQSDWNITDTNSDAFIKNKPQNLVNKIELPTMCPKGFYKEYDSLNLEPNSWYRIATNNNRVCRASGFFILDIEYDMKTLLENHLVFAVSNSTYSTTSGTLNPKVSIQTNSYVSPMIDKMRIAKKDLLSIFLDIKTTDFKVSGPIDARLYLNFMGVSFKYFETIEKVEEPQENILLEVNL